MASYPEKPERSDPVPALLGMRVAGAACFSGQAGPKGRGAKRLEAP